MYINIDGSHSQLCRKLDMVLINGNIATRQEPFSIRQYLEKESDNKLFTYRNLIHVICGILITGINYCIMTSRSVFHRPNRL